jgi:vancomycin permeability regulator SanA
VEPEAESLRDGGYDCVLVLGCRVYADGSMSPMLQDRMTVAVELMKRGVSDRLLVSGDHTTDAYNEVKAMKDFAATLMAQAE